MQQMTSFCMIISEAVSRWTNASESSVFDSHHLGQRFANSTFLPTTRYDHVWKMTNMVQTNLVIRFCWTLFRGRSDCGETEVLEAANGRPLREYASGKIDLLSWMSELLTELVNERRSWRFDRFIPMIAASLLQLITQRLRHHKNIGRYHFYPCPCMCSWACQKDRQLPYLSCSPWLRLGSWCRFWISFDFKFASRDWQDPQKHELNSVHLTIDMPQSCRIDNRKCLTTFLFR